MASENIPAKDSQYGPWIINFASVATANATVLNMTGGQVAGLTGLATAFETAMVDSNEARLNAKGKTATKRLVRTTSEEQFRAAARVITANPAISSALKSELGLNVSPSPVGPVLPVDDLSVKGFSNGDNKLVWKRATNAQGTVFQVQAKVGGTGPWVIVGTTTRIRFTHSGQTPGVAMLYRIVSERGGTLSSPSNEASVYAGEETQVFTLKQAA